MFRNHLAGEAGMNEQVTQFFFLNNLFVFYNQPCQITVKIIFSNDYFKLLFYASLTKLIGPIRNTINDMRIFLKNFFFVILGKVWVGATIEKSIIGYQDFWDKSLGWFLGFQYRRKITLRMT